MNPNPSTGTTSRCPECGGSNALPIIYGYPGPRAFEAAGEGRVVLGGCAIMRESPTRHCPDCGHRW